MRSTAARSPFNGDLRSSRRTTSSRRGLSPSSVRAYSRATASSSTPQRLRMTAQMTPVRSLPPVQWIRIGAGGSLSEADDEADEADGAGRDEAR